VAFPHKLLAPGEEIVLQAHPNWSILVSRISLFVLIVAGCVAVAVVWSGAPLWVGYVLLGIAGVFLLAVLAKVVVWRCTTLVLTNLRVVYRTGVLRRLGREIPLDRVQDVTYTQSIVERMVGAGSLMIESAGAGGEDPFPDISHPAVVQSLINRLITQPAHGYGGGAGGGLGGGGNAPQSQYPQPQYPQQPQPYPQQPYPQQPQAYPQQPQAYPQQPYPQQPQAYPQQPQAYPQQPQAYPQQAQYPQQPQAYPQESEPYPTRPQQSPSSQAPQSSGPPAPSPQQYRPAPGPAVDPNAGSSSDQLKRLSELLRLGVITNAEYEVKRREILEGR
jgi:membrane protein YdbS with pleckstrin-like domain